MLSRVAESIYWMARYIERAENVARIVDANYHMILDLPDGVGEQWEPLVVTSGDEELFKQLYPAFTREAVVQFLTFDTRNPNAILTCLHMARENARSVREWISSEMWQQVNTFYLMVKDAARHSEVLELPHEFFVEIMMAGHLFSGLCDNTMAHGEGWEFARLGRMLERADKTTRIIDVKYFILLPSIDYIGMPYDHILWASLLRSASAFEMYRKRYGQIAPDNIIEFLVLDNQFPRAIHHCLIMAELALRNISGTMRGRFTNHAEKSLGRLLADLDYIQVDEIKAIGLHEFLDGIQTRLNQVGAAVSETFFAVPLVAPAEQKQEIE
ncbi:alpha-E domain-containing protein [Geoalkalibacter halelectricus]|uniref:alpha-E domain-containing protein n=1 Tax=Geoalkalibacter halelectricus TaxID=2847045 RepID=UPI003D25A708